MLQIQDKFCLSQAGNVPPKICRICLEQQRQNQSSNNTNQMITPCKCTGSVKYVHQKCLTTWILHVKGQQIFKYPDNHLFTQNCEICNIKICFKTTNKIVCNRKSEILRKINKRMFIFIICFIINLLAISLFGFIIFEVVKHINKLFFDQDIFMIVIIVVAMGLICIVFMLSLLFIMKYFLVHSKNSIHVIKSDTKSLKSKILQSQVTLVSVFPQTIIEDIS